MPDYTYIYKIKFRKMGKWNLLPADSNGNWHSEETSRYFKKIFGFGKGTFFIQTLDDDMQHSYFPQFYIDKIYNYIRSTNNKDYKKLAKIFLNFYKLRVRARRAIPKTAKYNLKKFTNEQLIEVFNYNRDWAHRVTPYDQFGWIAEDYWPSVMEKILNRYGLRTGIPEYLKILFVLTKPEEISTTLMEKRAVLESAITIKQRKSTIFIQSKKLSKQYGWMPVFAFGVPWYRQHYEQELKNILTKSLAQLEDEYLPLQNYTAVRNKEINKVVNKYKFSPKDLQIFIDFGLALDTRNEAEYLVSLCGFYVLPIYNEIARRLYISVKQLRNLFVYEIIACLKGETKAENILDNQGKIVGCVFDQSMMRIKYLKAQEARKLFTYLNKNSKNLQGNDEYIGQCASPGKVSGRVKIILYPTEGNKVKRGDILIAHATTVDYLPPMKLAAAFVTEVGGLTCHAAVVAREFGVPAVVGLKNATKNFKDGDLVEVDANAGIVRKLK